MAQLRIDVPLEMIFFSILLAVYIGTFTVHLHIQTEGKFKESSFPISRLKEPP